MLQATSVKSASLILSRKTPWVSEMLRERDTHHVILPLYFAIWSLGTAASAPPAMLTSRR